MAADKEAHRETATIARELVAPAARAAARLTRVVPLVPELLALLVLQTLLVPIASATSTTSITGTASFYILTCCYSNMHVFFFRDSSFRGITRSK